MSKTPKPEKMWAIWNPDFGFYQGAHLDYAEMLNYHRLATCKTLEESMVEGDRAIRVLVTPVPRRKR